MAVTPLCTYELRSPTLGYEIVVLSWVDDDGKGDIHFTTSNIKFPPPPPQGNGLNARIAFEESVREAGWTIESATLRTKYDREHPIPLVPMAKVPGDGASSPSPEKMYSDWYYERAAKGLPEAGEEKAFVAGYTAAQDKIKAAANSRALPVIAQPEKGELLHGPWKDEGGLQLSIETGTEGRFELYYAWPGDDWCRSADGDPLQYALVREIVRLKGEATARKPKGFFDEPAPRWRSFAEEQPHESEFPFGLFLVHTSAGGVEVAGWDARTRTFEESGEEATPISGVVSWIHLQDVAPGAGEP